MPQSFAAGAFYGLLAGIMVHTMAIYILFKAAGIDQEEVNKKNE